MDLVVTFLIHQFYDKFSHLSQNANHAMNAEKNIKVKIDR